MHLKDSLIFLDFDGVICDSIFECFVSSWIAYFREFLKKDINSININYKDKFRYFRPFIRSGEDYILIHQLLYNGIIINNQKEFDSYIEKTGKIRMDEYKELLYRARTYLLNNDKDYWISLNHIYPPMKIILEQYQNHENLYIISTKKQRLILEILLSNNINMKPRHVIDSGKLRKLDIISGILDKSDVAKAVFIDDQIDHLLGNKNDKIEVYLADWGYIKQEWLSEYAEIKIMSRNSISGFFN